MQAGDDGTCYWSASSSVAQSKDSTHGSIAGT